jgi:DNA-binding CsgD family transcriptional regulator
VQVSCAISPGFDHLLGPLESLGPTNELARAYATFATVRMLSAQNATAAELAVRAQKIAGPLGALDVLSDALNVEAVCAAIRGEDWTPLMHRALEIALSAGLHEQAGRAYANFHSTYVCERRFAEAERYFADGIAYCDEHDLASYGTCLRNEQADVLERTGRWEESLVLDTELLASTTASPVSRLCTLTRHALIRARRGEPMNWDHLHEADAAADGAGEPQRMMSVRLARAEVHWLEGNPKEATREAERADDVAAGCDAWSRGAAAVWLVRTGSARPPSGHVAEPYRLELDGRWTKAARLWTELGCPYDAAMALAGAPDEKALRQAVKAFNSLSAFPAIRILQEKLRRIGARSVPGVPRSAARAHPFRLTQRESEVLALICAKRTNAQIATNLNISIKTAENHVTAVLRKMGAPNRAFAAHQAIQLDLPEARTP